MRTMLRITVLTVGFAALTGCPAQAPGPEAVLEGTWELTGDLVAEDLADFLITFDSNGDIAAIRYTVGIIDVNINNPAYIESVANVDGSDVSISASWLGINNLVFEGTLNANQDQIDGTTTFSIVVGGLTISIPTGDATLTKQ